MREVPYSARKILNLHGVVLMNTHFYRRDAYTDGQHFIAVCGTWIELGSAQQANPWWMATCSACLKCLVPYEASLRVERLTNAIVGAVFFVWFQPDAWDP